MPDPDRLPDFLVIGAMRSGTTGLARSLGAHPEVHMAPEKEVHFFDRHFDNGLRWYCSCFTPGRATAVGEATQTYLYDPVSLDRIVRTLPGVRLVALLRHPVDRAWSHYWLNRSLGSEPLGFETAVRAEPDRLAAGGADRFTYSYLDRGRYTRQLEAVEERFGRGALHVALFDDLRDHPAQTYAGVCRFLGVNDTVVPDLVGQQVNPQVRYRSVAVRRWARGLPRPAARVIGRLNTRPVEYPSIDPAVRSRLVASLAVEIDELEHWLGRDLSAWKA